MKLANRILALFLVLILGSHFSFGRDMKRLFISVPGGSTSVVNAWDINDAGQVVGFYFQGSNSHGFIYDENGTTVLDVPGATDTEAYGNNDSGDIVGFYIAGGIRYGFIYNGSTFTELTAKEVDGEKWNTYANDINDAGVVVGYSPLAFEGTEGFTYSGGAYTPFFGPGDESAVPWGINDSGAIVGCYTDDNFIRHGFVKDGANYTVLEYPGAAYGTCPLSINNSGVVVGVYYVASPSDEHGFLWDGNTFYELDYPSASKTKPTGVENGGDVVGTRNTTTSFIGLWEEGDPVGTDPEPEPDPETPTSESNANQDWAASDNDPINTFNGELYTEPIIDFDLGGPMPLRFERYYASFLRKNFVLGDLGSNWRHNFDFRALRSGTTFRYITDRGRVTRFVQNLDTQVWEQQDNLDTPYQVSAEANQDAVVFDPGTRMIYTFDYTTGGPVTGKLVKVEDGHGNAHALVYDTDNGQIQSVSDGIGRMLNFTYNEDTIPKISVVDDDESRAISFQYTDPNDSELLTLFRNARDKTTEYHYEDTSSVADHGLMLYQTNPRGNVPYVQTFYDTDTPTASGRVATQTDSNGNTFSLEYDGQDTTLTDPDGGTRIHTHTATGEFANREDQEGDSFSMGSDSAGRRSWLTDRDGDTTSMAYDEANGFLSELVNTEGDSTQIGYTPRTFGEVTLYDMTSVSLGDATSQSITYDANGNPLTHTDQEGNVTTKTFNSRGQVLTRTNAIGGVMNHTYNADGTLAATTDPLGNTTTYGYDAARRINQINYPGGDTETIAYNENDLIIGSTDANNNSFSLGYDDNDNLASYTDALNNTDTFANDGNDRLLSTIDSSGATTSQTYDGFGKVTSRTDANGNVTTFGYNSLRRLTRLTLPDDTSTGFTYTLEGILETTTDPLGHTSTFSSDSLGRITQETSPLGFTMQYEYDALSRVTSRTNELGQTTTLSRDDLGLLSSIELYGGPTASYTRDGLGNITQVLDPNGNAWLTGYNLIGQQSSFTDPLGNSQTTAYDSRNRPSTITFPGGLGTLTFAYDAVGNPITKTYSDGTVLDFTYDGNDRLTSANGFAIGYDSVGRVTSNNGITVTRDPGGRIATMTLSPGKIVTYSYDANDRLTQVSDWTGNGAITFSYDAAGRRTSITRPNGVNTTNTYDNDSRLTGIAEGTLSSISLSLDAAGQIVAANRDVPLQASAANLENIVSAYDTASQIDAFTYDAMGRLLNDGNRTLTFDLASRLKSIQEGGTTAQYTYDDLGLMTSRTLGGETRNYVWNHVLGRTSISIERNGSADLRYYVYTPAGQLLYGVDATGDARFFYHFDEMGNTIFITDESGAIEASYAYTPYGRLISKSGDLDNSFTWQGAFGVCDEGDDLYYMRARFYDASIGSFLSRDPVKSIDPREISPYQYALGNPLRYVDPEGRQGENLGLNYPMERLDDVKTLNPFYDKVIYFFSPDDLDPDAVVEHLYWYQRNSKNEYNETSKYISEKGISIVDDWSWDEPIYSKKSGREQAILAAEWALWASLESAKEAAMLHVLEVAEGKFAQALRSGEGPLVLLYEQLKAAKRNLEKAKGIPHEDSTEPSELPEGYIDFYNPHQDWTPPVKP